MTRRFLLPIITIWFVSCSETGFEQPIDKEVPFPPPPIEGVNYYRLMQVDKDGTTEYFKTMSVMVGKSYDQSNARSSNPEVQLPDSVVAPLANSPKFKVYTINSGVWSNGKIWNNGVPPPNSPDKVTKRTLVTIMGHDVTSKKGISFQNDGILQVVSGGILQTQDLNMNNNSELLIMPGSIMIVQGNLNMAKNSLVVNYGGQMVVAGNTKLDDNVEFYNFGNSYLDIEPEMGQGAMIVGSPTKDGSDLLDDDPVLWSRAFSTLPIELVFQSVKDNSDGSVLIEFETAMEENSDRVVVQWSIDAINWLDLKVIPSNNKPSYYEFVHK